MPWPAIKSVQRTEPLLNFLWTCENGDGADGSFKRPKAHEHDFFFAHEVASERTFQVQGCMASKMSRYLYISLNVDHRQKWKDFIINFTECYSKTWDDAVWKWHGWILKLIFYSRFLGSTFFPDTRYITDSNKTFRSRSRCNLIDSDPDSNSWLVASTPGDSDSGWLRLRTPDSDNFGIPKFWIPIGTYGRYWKSF